jgi:type IV secretory pathway TrbD component
MGTAALVVGIAVVVLTAASQTGVLGGQDFLVIAAVGLLGAIFSLVIALMQRSTAALSGLLLSLLPVALLVYYLSTTEG